MAEIAEEVRLRRAVGRPAAQARARARRALPGPFAGGGPRRRPGRGAAHGRRRHLHRPGGPGRVRAGGRRRRQEGHALAAPLVRRVGHAPDEPVGLRGQPGPAHRRRPPPGAGAPGGGPARPGRRRGRVPGPACSRTPGGSSPPWRPWPRRRDGSCTPPAATAGSCGAWWRPAATPTASTPAPAWSTPPSSARWTCAASPLASTCGPLPRPVWAPSC